MYIVADRVKYYVSMRPGWVALHGRLTLQNYDDDEISIIHCGDPRVLYLYWRMCIEHWIEILEVQRAKKKYQREHPDDSISSAELRGMFRSNFTPKRYARLRADIPTMEDAIGWLARQGLSFACRPANEHWELHFYPWWDKVTRGKIK